MPSRVVEVIDAAKDKGKDAPVQSAAVQSAEKPSTSASKKHRKITPPAAEARPSEAKKSKQPTLAAFFGKSKFPSTPAVATAKKNKPTATATTTTKGKKPQESKPKQPKQATTKQSKPSKKPAAAKAKPSVTKAKASVTKPSVTKPSVTKPSVASASSTATKSTLKKQTRPKMDFKDIIVGKVTAAGLASTGKPRVVVPSTGKKPTKAELNALLPRIPPLGDVLEQKLQHTTTTASKENTKADEQSEEGEQIAAVRLVHKFETAEKQPPNDKEEESKDNEEESKGKETTEKGDSVVDMDVDKVERETETAEEGTETAEKGDSAVDMVTDEVDVESEKTEGSKQVELKEPAKEGQVLQEVICLDSDKESKDKEGATEKAENNKQVELKELANEGQTPQQVVSLVSEEESKDNEVEDTPSPTSTTVTTTPPSRSQNSSTTVVRRPSTSSVEINTKWKKVKLGMKLAVHWSDNKYYPAVAAKVDGDNQSRFFFQFDDGEEEWMDLRQVTFRFMDDDMEMDEEEDEMDEEEEHVPKQLKEDQAAQADMVDLTSRSEEDKDGCATLNDETKAVNGTQIQGPPPAGTTKKAHLDSESSALLGKHESMRVKYCQTASKLVVQARDGFVEEEFEMAMPCTQDISLTTTEFVPDAAVPHLVCLVEGSKLPLSKLASKASESLKEAFGVSFSLEVVSSKIKVLASRKAHVKNPAIASGLPMANNISKDTDVFEDVNQDHMWRWEVSILELLPDDSVKAVKAARAVRRKLQNQFNASARLLAALNESIKLLREAKSTPAKSKIEKAVSKISREEEKVLKFEQEAEKARLSAEAKKLKSAQKQQKSKQDKERQMDEKRKAAEERKREKEEAKQKKALEKEEAKKKKELEKEEAKKKKELEKQQKDLEKQKKTQEREEAKRQKEEKERQLQTQKEKEKQKQKKRMMSFFSAPVKKAKEETNPKLESKATHNADNAAPAKDGFDSEKFRHGINSLDQVEKTSLFSSLSKRATASLKRRTKRVKMRVFVSGINADDPNPFAQPAFAEERIVEVRNRNKFLKFQEDCRPPYHGTWSKKSACKSLGRRPFSKEPTLDYDVDSEAEWEEGDDDPGEDVENDAGDDEDEKMLDNEDDDTRVYNYKDGWLAQDDDIIKVDDAEMDEQTKVLKASKKRADDVMVPACIIAPAQGGLPMVDEFKSAKDPLLKDVVDGRVLVEDAYKLAASHIGATLIETDLFLDAFPPALVDEREGTVEASSPPSNQPSEEDMKTIARFVHHSKLVSKSQVVEELRSAHASVTASRAQAQRILDSIAEKKRHPTDGVYWEVKQDVIESFSLGGELKPMVLPEPAPKKKESKKRKKSDGADSSAKTAKKAKTEDKPSGSATKSKGGSKKPVVSAASANLLAIFLTKKTEDPGSSVKPPKKAKTEDQPSDSATKSNEGSKVPPKSTASANPFSTFLPEKKPDGADSSVKTAKTEDQPTSGSATKSKGPQVTAGSAKLLAAFLSGKKC